MTLESWKWSPLKVKNEALPSQLSLSITINRRCRSLSHYGDGANYAEGAVPEKQSSDCRHKGPSGMTEVVWMWDLAKKKLSVWQERRRRIGALSRRYFQLGPDQRSSIPLKAAVCMDVRRYGYWGAEKMKEVFFYLAKVHGEITTSNSKVHLSL